MSKPEQKARESKELYPRRPYMSKALSSSTSSKRPTLSPEQVEEVTEAFKLFDSDNTGSIDLRELKASMRALGLELTRDDLKSILIQLSKSESAQTKITLDEFLSLMATRLPARDSREEIEKIFKLFDSDSTGYITFRALKSVCSELGEGLSDAEVQEMIDEADRDQDGKINFEEFYRIMKKRSDNPLDDWSDDDD